MVVRKARIGPRTSPHTRARLVRADVPRIFAVQLTRYGTPMKCKEAWLLTEPPSSECHYDLLLTSFGPHERSDLDAQLLHISCLSAACFIMLITIYHDRLMGGRADGWMQRISERAVTETTNMRVEEDRKGIHRGSLIHSFALSSMYNGRDLTKAVWTPATFPPR
nr:hypothetical protein CFP56_00367 [Quercus suber]